MHCGWGGPARSRIRRSRPAQWLPPALDPSTPGVLPDSVRRRRHLAFFCAVAGALPHQTLFLEVPDERLDVDWDTLRFGVLQQQFGGTQRFLLCPLRQPLDRCLVEFARRATARLVAQAVHAVLAPALPGLPDGADIEILQLGDLATQQPLSEQQQGLGAFACAPVW